MFNPQPDPRRFSRLRWIQQITENHCGPAVIQMLLENIGVNVTQQEIPEAVGATKTLETHGTRVDQLAKAVNQLVPIARLWYKEKASLDDPEYVLDVCKYPVGVEWQGLFDDMDDNNEVKDPQTGGKEFKKDEQLFFVVVPLSVTFPADLGLQSYYYVSSSRELYPDGYPTQYSMNTVALCV